MESGNIVNIRKKLSDENKKNRLLKDNMKTLEYSLKLTKSKKMLSLFKKKKLEEISATQKTNKKY